MTKAHWIPVSERLPGEGGECRWSTEVLVWPRSDNAPTAFYDHNIKLWCDGEGFQFDGVTHWALLPEGPQS